MTVIYLFRAAKGLRFSIEEVFGAIIQAVSKQISTGTFYHTPHIGWWANQKKLRQTQADIYHITGDINYLAIALLGKKVVLTIHDLGHYKNLKGWKKWLYGWLWIRIPLMIATKATCVSNYTREDIARFFPGWVHKVTVIPNPVAPIFQPVSYTFRAACPRILQVGTGPHKNLPTLIQALSGFPCTLAIIGSLSAEQQQLLEQYQIRYEVLERLSQEDVYEQYAACDLVCFVSLHEGFGMPVIEAQAVGRPIITTAVCSLPEVTQGSTPVLSSPLDAVALRQIIERVCSDAAYREQCIEQGFQNVQRFHRDTIAQQYLALYHRIIA